VLDAVGRELVRVGRGEDLVASDLRGDNLHDDVAVGEADNKSVLGSAILVLGLGDKSLTGVVVGLSLPSALELGLVAAVRKNPMSATFNLRADFDTGCSRVCEIGISVVVLTCSKRCSSQACGRPIFHRTCTSQQFALQTSWINPRSEASCMDSTRISNPQVFGV
jgi:hypothetical protein